MKKLTDIENLSNQINAFKNSQKAQKESDEQPSSQNAMKGFHLCIEFLCGVFIGLAIGLFLDDVFHTFPICLALFTVFGSAAGVLNAYRFSKQENGEI